MNTRIKLAVIINMSQYNSMLIDTEDVDDITYFIWDNFMNCDYEIDRDPVEVFIVKVDTKFFNLFNDLFSLRGNHIGEQQAHIFSTYFQNCKACQFKRFKFESQEEIKQCIKQMMDKI